MRAKLLGGATWLTGIADEATDRGDASRVEVVGGSASLAGPGLPGFGELPLDAEEFLRHLGLLIGVGYLEESAAPDPAVVLCAGAW